MNAKQERIAAAVRGFEGLGLDAHYLGYLDHFNRQLYYEAHDVLEEFWRVERHGPSGAFYKGLIQLAGAFVHLQKQRRGPAAALFRLAATNLQHYPAVYERLNVNKVLELIAKHLAKAEAGDAGDLIEPGVAPKLSLEAVSGSTEGESP